MEEQSALGHPIGASGVRILTTLAYGLLREHRRDTGLLHYVLAEV